MDRANKQPISLMDFYRLLRRFQLGSYLRVDDSTDLFIGTMDDVPVEIAIDYQKETGHILTLP